MPDPRHLLVAAVVLVANGGAAAAAERRCGWLVAPTPANLWLVDRHGTWGITSQGQAAGPDAVGADRIPAFDSSQFVETNVPGAGYGYGCACLTVETDAAEKRVTRVFAGDRLPLARCRADRSLPPPPA